MPEYIDREAVLDKAFSAGLCDAYGNTYGGGDVIIADDIKAIPAADVAPVRHGKWICTGNMDRKTRETHYKCSICGFDATQPHPLNYSYCPNCGAKMDGEV